MSRSVAHTQSYYTVSSIYAYAYHVFNSSYIIEFEFVKRPNLRCLCTLSIKALWTTLASILKGKMHSRVKKYNLEGNNDQTVITTDTYHEDTNLTVINPKIGEPAA